NDAEDCSSNSPSSSESHPDEGDVDEQINNEQIDFGDWLRTPSNTPVSSPRKPKEEKMTQIVVIFSDDETPLDDDNDVKPNKAIQNHDEEPIDWDALQKKLSDQHSNSDEHPNIAY